MKTINSLAAQHRGERTKEDSTYYVGSLRDWGASVDPYKQHRGERTKEDSTYYVGSLRDFKASNKLLKQHRGERTREIKSIATLESKKQALMHEKISAYHKLLLDRSMPLISHVEIAKMMTLRIPTVYKAVKEHKDHIEKFGRIYCLTWRGRPAFYLSKEQAKEMITYLYIAKEMRSNKKK